jgi:hypothetical protein
MGLKAMAHESETSKDNDRLFVELLAEINTNPEHPVTDHTHTGFSPS